MIPLLCGGIDFLLSLPVRTVNKTGPDLQQMYLSPLIRHKDDMSVACAHRLNRSGGTGKVCAAAFKVSFSCNVCSAFLLSF